MLKVFLFRNPDFDKNYTWSNVTDKLVSCRVPKFLDIIEGGKRMELHFDVTISFTALVLLESIDKALREFNFANIDCFTLEN